MTNNDIELPKIGKCYKSQMDDYVIIYETPFTPWDGDQPDDRIDVLDENQIFLLLEHLLIPYKTSPQPAVYNFKILTNNKIGWVFVDKRYIKDLFHEIVI